MITTINEFKKTIIKEEFNKIKIGALTSKDELLSYFSKYGFNYDINFDGLYKNINNIELIIRHADINEEIFDTTLVLELDNKCVYLFGTDKIKYFLEYGLNQLTTTENPYALLMKYNFVSEY